MKLDKDGVLAIILSGCMITVLVCAILSFNLLSGAVNP